MKKYIKIILFLLCLLLGILLFLNITPGHFGFEDNDGCSCVTTYTSITSNKECDKTRNLACDSMDLMPGSFLLFFNNFDFNLFSKDSVEVKTYKNSRGGFSLIVPSNIKILEMPEREDKMTLVDGKQISFTTGEVYFTFGKINKKDPKGLIVQYVKPFIEGKGGACMDKNGNGAYKSEVIAGQEVSVCEIEGFKAEYFKNPKGGVEYGVYTLKVDDQKEIAEYAKIIRQSLKFE